VAELLRKANAAAEEDEMDDSEESPVVEPIHRNQLPDVYPEDRPAGI
jgi:hypothetical protein